MTALAASVGSMAVLKLSGPAPLLRGIRPISWAPTSIDLIEVSWLTPFDVVGIASLRARLAAEGQPPILAPPQTPAVREYATAVGLIEGAGDRPASRGLALELLQLPTADAWDDLLGEIAPDFVSGLPDRFGTRGLDVLSELIDNAGTHGSSAAGTFVCAQCYDGGCGLPAGLWLGVADAGLGIPGHLRLNPRYAEIERDEELIRLARRPWVTGTRDRRGWGLVAVFEGAAGATDGDILIRSGGGEGFFHVRPEGRPYARYSARTPRLPGTWVHVRLGA
jgi:hypothetical protein